MTAQEIEDRIARRKQKAAHSLQEREAFNKAAVELFNGGGTPFDRELYEAYKQADEDKAEYRLPIRRVVLTEQIEMRSVAEIIEVGVADAIERRQRIAKALNAGDIEAAKAIEQSDTAVSPRCSMTDADGNQFTADENGIPMVMVHPAIVKRRYRFWKRLQGQSRGTDRQLKTDLIATAGRVRDRFRRKTKVAGLGEAWLRYMILQSGLGTGATQKASVIVIAGWSSARIKQVQRLSKAIMAEHKTEKECPTLSAALLTELISEAALLDGLPLEKGFERLPYTLADEIRKRLNRAYCLEADAPEGQAPFDIGEATSRQKAGCHTLSGDAPDPQRKLEEDEAEKARAERRHQFLATLTDRERAFVEVTWQINQQETPDSPKLTDQAIADSMNALTELAKPTRGYTAPDVRNLRMRAYVKYAATAE